MANYKKYTEPVRLTIRLEKMVKDKLEIRAISKGISITDLLNPVIKDYLRKAQD